MAYQRRFGKQVRNSSQRRQGRSRMNQVRMSRAGYGASARSRLVRTLSVVPGRARAEVKMVDQVNGNTFVTLPLNTTASIQCLNLIQEGSSFYNRIGRRIEMKSVHLTGIIQQTSHATVINDYVRILVVYDRQPNGALPAISTMLASYDQTGTSTTTVFDGVNPDQRERFAVMADIRLALPASSGTSAGAPSSSSAADGVNATFNINRFINLRGLQTHYQASSNPAVIGDVSTGALYIVGFGGIASGSEGYQGRIGVRLRYCDT